MKALIATLAMLVLLIGCKRHIEHDADEGKHIVAQRTLQQCKWILRYDPFPGYRNFSWETTWQESDDLDRTIQSLPMSDFPAIAWKTSGVMYINGLANAELAQKAVIAALNTDMQNHCLNGEQP